MKFFYSSTLLFRFLQVSWLSTQVLGTSEKINLSTECTKFCAKTDDEIVNVRAENAMLRSLVKGLRHQIKMIQPQENEMAYEHMVSLNLAFCSFVKVYVHVKVYMSRNQVWKRCGELNLLKDRAIKYMR